MRHKSIMLLDDDYSYAHDFLQSVVTFARTTDFISIKQKAAVDKIKEKSHERS